MGSESLFAESNVISDVNGGNGGCGYGATGDAVDRDEKSAAEVTRDFLFGGAEERTEVRHENTSFPLLTGINIPKDANRHKEVNGMSDKEKLIVTKICELPDGLLEKFVQQLEGAALAVEYMAEQKKKEAG